MTDNTDIKNGLLDNGVKCPVYCDFCDWLGAWHGCWIVQKRKDAEKRFEDSPEGRVRVHMTIDNEPVEISLTLLKKILGLTRV